MSLFRRAVALLLLASTFAAACSSGDDASDESRAATTTASPSPDASEDAAAPDVPEDTAAPEDADDGRGSEYLFDQSMLHTFELNLSEEDLAFLDADPAAEEYVPGTLTFEGETIPVGIRYKGSIGAFVFCLDNPNPFDPSGPKQCPKLSMKIKINWEDPKAEFLGVRKLQFHSMNNDRSQLVERLGYWLWNEMDVAAPRATHARVIVNGEFSGLYALVENIDGRFARHHFDDGSGNVYKEVWPVTLDGGPFDEDVYLDSLRTNEDDDPSAAFVMRFAEELTAASDADARAEVVREYMDVERLMNQLAVDRTIVHDDGPFHWYCIPNVARNQPCDPHNFFWYEEPEAEQLHMIPWDIDNAFQSAGNRVEGFIPVKDALGEISNDCEPFPFGSFNLPQLSASCDLLFSAWGTMTEEYAAAFDRLHDGPFSPEVLDPLLDEWIAQIEEATAEAAATYDQAITLNEWSDAVDQLRTNIDLARENRPA